MPNSYFERLEPNIVAEARNFADVFRPILEQSVCDQQRQYYIIDKPLAEEKYNYEYKKAIVVLSPDSKILFIDFGENTDDHDNFENYYNDFLNDIGSLIKKFDFLDVIDRPRKWKDLVTDKICYKDLNNINEIFDYTLVKDEDKRLVQIIISLLTESINDVKRIKGTSIPNSLLDKVKQRIILFDTDQTNFLYKEPTKKITTIQGLSGTGKTELLLHKLKSYMWQILLLRSCLLVSIESSQMI